jgi:putative sulfotransferase
MPEAVTVGVAIITRDDLPKLKDLLQQVSLLDQVVVLDTGSRDGTRKYVRKLGPPFELHEFKWRPRPEGHGPDDWGFAAARNESFKHVTTTHVVWLDSDDLVAGIVDGERRVASPEGVNAAFRKVAGDNSSVDAWLMDYVYMTDEFDNPTSVIAKERMLRTGAGFYWRYPVHELLFPRGQVTVERVVDLVILHRPHDVEKSVRRNGPMLRAWLRQLEQKGRPPKEPVVVSDRDLYRARYLVGRSFWGQGKYLKAANWILGQFLAKHPDMPPDDKWEGWMDVARALVEAGDRDGARHATLQAIGLCPRFGEAYILLADLKSTAGERPGDILKLVEIAESCLNESYGAHEHHPMSIRFNGAILAAESQRRLGRDHEALALADRALTLRPGDGRARQIWEQAAAASKAKLEAPAPAPAIEQSEAVAAARGYAPVFVVSSGRCGSTLVSNMLRLHPDILSLSEFIIMVMPGGFPGGGAPIYGPQFWALLSTPRKRMTLMYRHGIVFEEVLYRPGPGRRFTAETGVPPILLTALPHLTDEPEVLYDEIHEWVVAQGAYPVGVHYLRLFDWLRDRLERKLWVERSGSLLMHLGELIANFPEARFIHMFRDGRECAISMSRHSAFRLSMISGQLEQYIGVDPFNSDEPLRGEVPAELQKFMPETFDADAFWSYDLPAERLGASWQAAETQAIGLLAQLPAGRVHQLRYENLVANPELELAGLLQFIGLPEADREYIRAAAALVKPQPPKRLQLSEEERVRLDESCRLAMGLLYGSEALDDRPPAGSTPLDT